MTFPSLISIYKELFILKALVSAFNSVDGFHTAYRGKYNVTLPCSIILRIVNFSH